MLLHVSHERRLAEPLPAHRAQVRGALVQALVLPERRVAQEALVAVAAREYPPSLVQPLVLVVAGLAGESLLALAAVVRHRVELHVRLQLIWELERLLAFRAFGLVRREVFVHGPRAQKSPVLSLRLFPFGLFLLVFRVAFFDITLPVVTFVLAVPFLLRRCVFFVSFLCFRVEVFAFSLGPPDAFRRRLLFLSWSSPLVLPLDVLLDLLLQAVSKGTLRADV